VSAGRRGQSVSYLQAAAWGRIRLPWVFLLTGPEGAVGGAFMCESICVPAPVCERECIHKVVFLRTGCIHAKTTARSPLAAAPAARPLPAHCPPTACSLPAHCAVAPRPPPLPNHQKEPARKQPRRSTTRLSTTTKQIRPPYRWKALGKSYSELSSYISNAMLLRPSTTRDPAVAPRPPPLPNHHEAAAGLVRRADDGIAERQSHGTRVGLLGRVCVRALFVVL
jgi:hypothetical protein